MQFKKLMLVLTFTVSIIFVTVIGGTYAYYNTVGGSVSGTTGPAAQKPFTVVYNGSNTFDFNVGIPIAANEYDSKAMHILYDLNVSNLDYVANYEEDDTIINIYLTDVEIDDALKVSDFKYYTMCDVRNNSNVFAGNEWGVFEKSGTGTDFNSQSFLSSNKLNILSIDTAHFAVWMLLLSSDVSAGSRFQCATYIWLQESGANQNSLMSKHFSANLEVEQLVK